MVAKRRQTKRVILLPVLLIAHTNESHLQEADNGCEHFLLRQTLPRKVAFHAGANSGQHLREIGHAIEFRFVPHLPPARMVAVLLAFPGITADSLKVPFLDRTDPDVGPGGRNSQGSNSGERRRIA